MPSCKDVLGPHVVDVRTVAAKLLEVVQGWPAARSGGETLYITYPEERDQDRCDVYDNALLANAFLMLAYDAKAVSRAQLSYVADGVLLRFDNAFAHLADAGRGGLLEAAFSRADPTRPTDVGQDVGNNVMAGVSLAKAALYNHGDVAAHVRSLRYLVRVLSSPPWSCGDGIVRRAYEQDGAASISTEHMIDVAAWGLLAAQVLQAHGHDDEARAAVALSAGARRFVRDAYVVPQSLYTIGGACWNGTATPMQQLHDAPYDTNGWNFLAAADDDPDRKAANLRQILQSFFVDDATNPGVKFSVKADHCSQYENTGSFLCAVAEYCRRFPADAAELYGNDRYSAQLLNIYEFLKPKVLQGERIRSSYSARACDTGLGWKYGTTSHLASTVYCYLAFANLTGCYNVYQLGAVPPVPELRCHTTCEIPSFAPIDARLYGEGSGDEAHDDAKNKKEDGVEQISDPEKDKTDEPSSSASQGANAKEAQNNGGGEGDDVRPTSESDEHAKTQAAAADEAGSASSKIFWVLAVAFACALAVAIIVVIFRQAGRQ